MCHKVPYKFHNLWHRSFTHHITVCMAPERHGEEGTEGGEWVCELCWGKGEEDGTFEILQPVHAMQRKCFTRWRLQNLYHVFFLDFFEGGFRNYVLRDEIRANDIEETLPTLYETMTHDTKAVASLEEGRGKGAAKVLNVASAGLPAAGLPALNRPWQPPSATRNATRSRNGSWSAFISPSELFSFQFPLHIVNKLETKWKWKLVKRLLFSLCSLL